MAYGPVIRRRVTGKMGLRLRRLFDSEDILSTVLRRLDRYVQDGNLRVASQPQFLALLREICEAAVVDKARVMRRLERVEREDGPLATSLRGRLERRDESGGEGDETLAAAFGALADETDRRILWHWLSGREHGITAELVGMTPAAVRQRWKRIRERVRQAIERSAA